MVIVVVGVEGMVVGVLVVVVLSTGGGRHSGFDSSSGSATGAGPGIGLC